MGKNDSLKILPPGHFRRLTGVKRETIEKMIGVCWRRQGIIGTERLEERED